MVLVEIVACAIDAQDDLLVNVKGKDAGISNLFRAVEFIFLIFNGLQKGMDSPFINRIIDEKHRAPHDPVKRSPGMFGNDFHPFGRDR